MDNFETPYEDDDVNDFITCTMCDKSIKGNSLYKIHLTTSSHLKKEDDLVSRGLLNRKKRAPVFQDVSQYLDYLQLVEPIIGLGVLQQLTQGNADKSAWPLYSCHLCKQQLDLPEMVHHLIGRKHRKKYIESKRPDLVTWDLESHCGAKFIRNKAEIVEREEGRGWPKPIKNSRNMKNTQHPPTKPQGQNPKGSAPFPQFKSKRTRAEFFQSKRFNGLRQNYEREGNLGHGPSKKDNGPNQEDWVNERKESAERHFLDTDSHGQYDQIVQQPQLPNVCKPVLPRYSLRDESPHRSVKEHSLDVPYSDLGHHQHIYSNTKQGRDYQHSNYKSPVHNGNEENKWSPSDIYTTREEWQGQNKPAPNSDFVTRHDSHDRILVKDYNHQLSLTSPTDRFENPGFSRTESPTLLSTENTNRTISSIPEPFMRFLERAEDHKGNRKRNADYSVSPAEEVGLAKKVFLGKYSKWNPNQTEDQQEYPSMSSGPFILERDSIQAELLPGYSQLILDPTRRERSPNRAEFQQQQQQQQQHQQHQHSSMLDDSLWKRKGQIDVKYQLESMAPAPWRPEPTSFIAEDPALGIHQREMANPEAVLDILDNVEIENAEDATFLKNKLLNILDEYKAKKMKNTIQYQTGNENSINPGSRTSKESPYERCIRGVGDVREDHMRSGWRDDNRGHASMDLDYRLPMTTVHKPMNRWAYEERASPANVYTDERQWMTKRLPEYAMDHGHQPIPMLAQCRNAGPSRDLDPTMPRGPQYSSNINKLNSTLMALIRRK